MPGLVTGTHRTTAQGNASHPVDHPTGIISRYPPSPDRRFNNPSPFLNQAGNEAENELFRGNSKGYGKEWHNASDKVNA